MKMEFPKIVAEIGCNHKGDMAIAKEMIMTAATYCKADVVKFQKRCNKELLTSEEYNAPHPHPENSYGATYGAHREFLEFNLDIFEGLHAFFNVIFKIKIPNRQKYQKIGEKRILGTKNVPRF